MHGICTFSFNVAKAFACAIVWSTCTTGTTVEYAICQSLTPVLLVFALVSIKLLMLLIAAVHFYWACMRNWGETYFKKYSCAYCCRPAYNLAICYALGDLLPLQMIWKCMSRFMINEVIGIHNAIEMGPVNNCAALMYIRTCHVCLVMNEFGNVSWGSFPYEGF